MHDEIERERKADGGDPFGHLHLAVKAAFVAADAVGHFGIGALERQLDMVETGGVERRQTFLGQANAGGDEVGVEARVTGGCHQLFEIAARGGFAA